MSKYSSLFLSDLLKTIVNALSKKWQDIIWQGVENPFLKTFLIDRAND
ncbi:MAG: hypothetical protein H0U75_08500 [Legionella sp.]|nr:hypothetical protein [Legionella sp.]